MDVEEILMIPVTKSHLVHEDSVQKHHKVDFPDFSGATAATAEYISPWVSESFLSHLWRRGSQTVNVVRTILNPVVVNTKKSNSSQMHSSYSECFSFSGCSLFKCLLKPFIPVM